MIGKTLGRYDIVDELGAGGMATVYRARDRELGREVAIKMMHPHLAKRPEYAERFRREARAVAALRHPHIIEIHDFVSLEQDDVPLTFMVSELIEGPALSTFLAGQRKVLPEVAALVCAQVAEALACAHDAGIIHRDVKPENIMVAPGGRVVLTDFGIARVLEGDTVTATGALIGSPSYMSPEQAQGVRPRRESDLFSLGVVLYRMATGQLPFPGRDPIVVITAITRGRYKPPLQVAPAVGSGFDRLVRKCLEVAPEDRWESAQSLAEALTDFAAEGGLTDADGELKRFFDAPEEHEANATRRVVTRLMERAEHKASTGALAGALSLCDRALSLDPDNATAQQMLTDISRRRSGRRFLWIGLAVAAVVALAVAAVLLLWHSGAASKRPRVAVAPPVVDAGLDAAGQGDAAVDAAAAPGPADAAPSSVAVDAKASRAVPPRQRRWRPRAGSMPPPAVDAAVPHPAPRPDAAAPRPNPGMPPVRPRAAPGSLIVTVLPFCAVKVDGRAVGSSPMPRSVSLSAGWHTVTCRHAPSGRVFQKRVHIDPGHTLRLRGSVLGESRVTVRLSRGDAIRVGNVTYRGGTHRLVPGRFRYQLLKGEGAVQTGWISIPPGRCVLVDSPTPRCQ